MSRPWFDPETTLLVLDDYVLESPTYQRIMADAKVTDEEMEEQRQRVVSLLKELDSTLQHAERDMVEELLIQLSVLYAVEHRAKLQTL